MSEQRPPVGFHFRVEFVGLKNLIPGVEDVGFQEVTGLSSTISTEDFKEGGENRFTHKLPSGATYTNITLKRGMLSNSQLINWFKAAVEAFQFLPCDMIITLLNDQHEPMYAWNIVMAYPIKWSVSGMNAQEAGLMIEQVELVYQYYKTLPM